MQDVEARERTAFHFPFSAGMTTLGYERFLTSLTHGTKGSFPNYWDRNPEPGLENPMFKYLHILALALALVLASAVAQNYGGHRGTEEQQRACRPDVLRHCRGISSDYAMEDCLRQHVHVLRPACRRVITGG